MIDSWEDLREILTGNFQGPYVRPSNAWDLKSCHLKLGEPLLEYIRCFSQKCHMLPKVGDTDVISSSWSGTIYCTLVHELGHDQLRTTKELLDITTQHAYGEKAVEATFVQGNGKMVPGSSHGGHRPKLPARALRKVQKAVKRGKSGASNGLQLPPATEMTTRERTAPNQPAPILRSGFGRDKQSIPPQANQFACHFQRRKQLPQRGG
jgi:hypothetical protein